jgi:hypothetical protein
MQPTPNENTTDYQRHLRESRLAVFTAVARLIEQSPPLVPAVYQCRTRIAITAADAAMFTGFATFHRRRLNFACQRYRCT